MINISERDLEYLSAYLDDALSPAETASLKTRLNQEPELQKAFDRLRSTRQVLRAAPKFRVPRNFTLSPEMVKAPQSAIFNFNLMRLTSVFASILFVFVLIGDIVGTSLIPFAAQTDTAIFSQEKMMDSEEFGMAEMPRSTNGEGVSELESMAFDEMPEDILEEAVEPEMAPLAAPMETEEEHFEEESPEIQMEKEVEPEAIVEASEPPALDGEMGEMEGGGEYSGTQIPTDLVSTEMPTLVPTPLPSPTPAEPTPTESDLVMLPTPGLVNAVDDNLQEQPDDPMRVFRFILVALEFGLGGIALGAGVTAYFMRKRAV